MALRLHTNNERQLYVVDWQMQGCDEEDSHSIAFEDQEVAKRFFTSLRKAYKIKRAQLLLEYIDRDDVVDMETVDDFEIPET